MRISLYLLSLICLVSCQDTPKPEGEKEKKCPPGTMQTANGCSACSINYYNPSEGGTCTPCPSGSTSNIADWKCEPCGRGTIGTGPGSGCRWCPIDHFSDAIGSSSPCRRCPKGSEANSARTGCDYIYDYRYYHNEYILDTEKKVPGTVKATLSNFRLFLKSLNYDFVPKDFSSEIGDLLNAKTSKVVNITNQLLKGGELTFLSAERLNPDILSAVDKWIKKLPILSGPEAAVFLKYTKFYGGAAKYLEKASVSFGFVTAIAPKFFEDLKNKEKFSKMLGDFVTDSTTFFVTEAATSVVAEYIAGALFAGAALETVGVGLLIVGGVALLPDDMIKVNGKLPVDYFREFMGELTRGLGDDLFPVSK